jgi:hypothetical protein
MKAKSGRPKGDRVTQVTAVRLEVGVLSRLRTLSKETGIPQNQLMCNFIGLGLELAESPAGKAAFELRRWADALREQIYAPVCKSA